MSNLDQVAIVDSTGKHLDALKTTIGWALLVAIVFAGAGLTGDERVKAFGLTIDINHAFFVAAAFYTFVNLKVLALLIRLRHLMYLLEDSELVGGLNSPWKKSTDPSRSEGWSVVDFTAWQWARSRRLDRARRCG